MLSSFLVFALSTLAHQATGFTGGSLPADNHPPECPSYYEQGSASIILDSNVNVLSKDSSLNGQPP